VDNSTTRGRAAGALNVLRTPSRRRDLEPWSAADLAAELLARLQSDECFARDQDLVVAGQLYDRLGSAVNVHLNRFSRRRLYDVSRPVLDALPQGLLPGATIVDLGSGSLNPLVFGFVLLALGAQRAYSIDLEPMQDQPRALKALADAAGWLLVDGAWVVGEHAPSPETVLQNLHGFHLPSLAAGDLAGLDRQRLIHRVESIYELSLADGEADLVATVSLLEHVDRVEDALASLRRITKVGGVGHHIIDFVDHRLYSGEVQAPFEFLKIDTRAPIVHGSNRLRCADFCREFERFGFELVLVEPVTATAIDPATHRTFSEPFRSMSIEELAIGYARFVVRRRE
jgi:SAM-dependent methyltransferase